MPDRDDAGKWKDDTDSFPIAINIYDEDGESINQYYTVVIRDESYEDGYIISDVVNMIAPGAERRGIEYPDDEDDE